MVFLLVFYFIIYQVGFWLVIFCRRLNFINLSCQVERISYFGKSDKGIRRSSEVQVKLPDSGSVWDSQPLKTDDEENVMLTGSTFQTDDLNLGV